MDILSNEIQDSISKLTSLTSKVPTRIGMIRKELELCDQEELDIKHTDVLAIHTTGISQSIASRDEFKRARTYSVRIRKDLIGRGEGIVAR